MRPAAHVKGTTLLELVVASGLGLLVLGALVAAVAAAGRVTTAIGARAEAEDTAQLAVEAFRFDVRRAGFDPAAVGVEPLTAALTDQLALQADLDGDGTVGIELAIGAGGLAPADRARVRRVTLDLAVALPGGGEAAARNADVALRGSR
jgi:Tfp pilus assembly protein PilW